VGVDDEPAQILHPDLVEPDENRRIAVVVRLGEEDVGVGLTEGELLVLVGDRDGEDARVRDAGGLRVGALEPDPADGALLLGGGHLEREAPVHLGDALQRQGELADVILARHAGRPDYGSRRACA
jgi:hypothetical protein